MSHINLQNIKFAFWGTGPLAESTIYSLYKNNLVPEYIVTKPDTAVGRHQTITPPYIKEWAKIKNINVIQPESLNREYLDKEENREMRDLLLRNDINIHIVASYGKIIPEYLLNTPSSGFINVHPSDLPQYRGPSPIQYAMLDGKRDIFVTIMKLNKDMDAGDILIKQPLFIDNEDTSHTIEMKSGQIGGELIYKILEAIVNNNIISIPQDHSLATYTTFINKSMGEIDLNDDIEIIKNKYRALTPWPGIFFFHNTIDNKSIRVKINKVNIDADNINDFILSVTPEGKKEISFIDFKNGYTK